MLAVMLESGELDALITPNMPSPLGRGRPRVRRLLPNYNQVEMDYLQRARIFPIMHTVVLRNELFEKHLCAAQNIFRAFAKAKVRKLEEM